MQRMVDGLLVLARSDRDGQPLVEVDVVAVVDERVDEWRALGVRTYAPIGGQVLTTLFQPDGPGTRAWLLTGNYRVILQYNCSNYYAMSVGLLADEIAN